MKLRSIVENGEYAGLEDADEFHDYSSCMHCGGVDESLAGSAWCNCEICDNSLCSDCGHTEISKDWLFVSRVQDYGVTRAYCPDHADYAPEGAVTPAEHLRNNRFAPHKITENDEYAGLEDADEFEDEDALNYEDQIFKQATITRGLPRVQNGDVNSPHPDDHVAIVNLMHFEEGHKEWHFFEVGVTPWDEPEILASFDEAVERCKPFATELIRTALEEYEDLIRWMDTVGEHPDGRPGDARKPTEDARRDMEAIQAGDLSTALKKILV